MLYQLVTGRLPFDGKNAFAVGRGPRRRTRRSAATARPGVADGLDAIIVRALAKAPETATHRVASSSRRSTPIAGPLWWPRRGPAIGAAARLWPWIVAPSRAAIMLAVLWATGVFAQKGAVPNVVGATLASAQTTLTGAGFNLGTVGYQQAVGKPQGTVISQTPPPGHRPQGAP